MFLDVSRRVSPRSSLILLPSTPGNDDHSEESDVARITVMRSDRGEDDLHAGANTTESLSRRTDRCSSSRPADLLSSRTQVTHTINVKHWTDSIADQPDRHSPQHAFGREKRDDRRKRVCLSVPVLVELSHHGAQRTLPPGQHSQRAGDVLDPQRPTEIKET